MNSGKEAEGKEKRSLLEKQSTHGKTYTRKDRRTGELRERRALGKFKSFIKGQFYGSFVFLLASHLVLSPLAKLSQEMQTGV